MQCLAGIRLSNRRDRPVDLITSVNIELEYILTVVRLFSFLSPRLFQAPEASLEILKFCQFRFSFLSYQGKLGSIPLGLPNRNPISETSLRFSISAPSSSDAAKGMPGRVASDASSTFDRSVETTKYFWLCVLADMSLRRHGSSADCVFSRRHSETTDQLVSQPL